MSTSSQMLRRAPTLAVALLLGAAGCATTTTTADGEQKPRMRTVCVQQESASGSRLSRRICRQDEVEPAAEAASDAEAGF